MEKRPVVTHFSLVFIVFTVAKLGSGEEISGYFRELGETVKPETELKGLKRDRESIFKFGDELFG